MYNSCLNIVKKLFFKMYLVVQFIVKLEYVINKKFNYISWVFYES